MPSTSRATRFARWVRSSRLPLRLVHLLIGSTLARQRPLARGGRGLAGIRERVRIFAGDLEVGACDGMWRLDVTLPLSRAEGS